MSTMKEQQLSFQLTSALKPKNEKEDSCGKQIPESNKCVVRSIVSELKEKKKQEDAKIYERIISRARHILD